MRSLPATLASLLLLAASFPAIESAATLDPAALTEIDRAIEKHIAAKKIPGGVLHLEHKNTIHHKAFGNRATLPAPSPVALDTIYDGASLTKVVATTPSIMLLRKRGLLTLDDSVAQHLPAFAGPGRDAITIRHLLTHTSGLRPGIPRDHEWADRADAFAYIFADTPLTPPGTTFRYSDLNFILLGEIVAKLSGRPLDQFAREEIFEPLKMTDTGFLPPSEKLPRIAPTTKEPDGTITHGIVHDPTSRKMGGVTGHAGLFTTAPDLARFARMLQNGGTLEDVRTLSPSSIALMTRLHTPPDIGNRRALGWDIDSLSSSPCGEIFLTGFGHTGWTGPSLWIDPTSETAIIFLTNRNHPTERGSTRELRHRIGTLVAQAVGVTNHPTVRNGIDVLADNDFKALAGRHIGLITNHTGRANDGRTTIDLLHQAKDVQLTALFSPEHGICGEADESVDDETDKKTGLPVHSLYREKNRKPTSTQLQDLDALVFDIQDIGCRFYTYISTMGNAMEAAANVGIEFIVLDRLNPIGGEIVAGPVRDGAESFTAFHPIPVRHGMTVGELAHLFQTERPALTNLNLTVIPVEGWQRDQLFDETGHSWVNPSPNMRSLTEALLYPGIGLLEFMKLSVGRGTDTPFEILGAPYLDGERLAAELNNLNLSGLHFEPTTYTPDASVYKDEECHGVRISLTNRNPDSLRAGIAIATHLHRHYPDRINYPNFTKLLVHPATFEAVNDHKSLNEIEALWQPALTLFETRRAAHLIHP